MLFATSYGAERIVTIEEERRKKGKKETNAED
jgi:hypothetical protein